MDSFSRKTQLLQKKSQRKIAESLSFQGLTQLIAREKVIKEFTTLYSLQHYKSNLPMEGNSINLYGRQTPLSNGVDPSCTIKTESRPKTLATI